MNKPNWHKGDVIAMPNNLIYHGCAVFLAEHEPHEEHGKWLYGARSCDELRPATFADIDRLLEITGDDIRREHERFSRLLELRKVLQK